MVSDLLAKPLISDTSLDPFWLRYHRLGSLICLPILWPSGASFGILCLYHSRPYHLTELSLQLAQLNINSIQLSLTEILRQHRADEALARGAQTDLKVLDLQIFIDSFEEHIWVKNVDGIYTSCNLSVEKAWGIPCSEIVGKSDVEIW